MKIIYLFFLTACTSCLSLESVQQYAAESSQGVGRFEEVALGFRDLCQQRRQWRDLRYGYAQRTYQDSCRLHQQADSALAQMQTAVQDYLVALQEVSAGERITYDLTPAGEALTSSDLVSLNANTVGAYQNLLELLATAATEAYRRRQVAQLVGQAHPSLVTLIDQLTTVVDESLREAVLRQQEMRYLNVRELADSARTFVERRSLWQEYISETTYYEEQQQLLDTYVAILKAVRDGHQQLYDQRDRLNRRETISALAFYLKELRDLQQSFRQEKSEDGG